MNVRLKENKCELRIQYYNVKTIILNNNITLYIGTKEYNQFKNRLSKKMRIIRYFDVLYGYNNELKIQVYKFYRKKMAKYGSKCLTKKGRICTQSTKQKISFANSGNKNGMYGKILSDEHKLKQSVSMKKLIKDGKFTPNTNNRLSRFKSKYKNKIYRSSWEVIYQYNNQLDLYENLRIEYQYNNNTCIYIVDFVNNETKTVTEVKPKRLFNDPKIKAKIKALNEYCLTHKYKLIIADEHYLYKLNKPIDSTIDNETKKRIDIFYETYKTRNYR